MGLWSAGNSMLDLGFIHLCFPWFPGGGWWGRMALHSHSGAPATYVPWLLADGVGAGSKRDCHGHCRRGKENGHRAICSWGRGGCKMGFVSLTLLLHPSSCSTVSLKILFSLACTWFLFFLLCRFVLFPKDNGLLHPMLKEFLNSFPCIATNKNQTNKCTHKKQTSVQPIPFCVPDKTVIFPLEFENLGLLWVNGHISPARGRGPLTCHGAYQLQRDQKLLFP